MNLFNKLFGIKRKEKFKRTLQIEDKVYPVHVTVEERSNSRVSISKRAINVRIPSWVKEENREAQINKMLNWAQDKLINKPDLIQERKYRSYRNEDILVVGDEKFFIQVSEKSEGNSSSKIEGNVIQIVVNAHLNEKKKIKQVSGLVSRCIGSFYLPKISQQLHELNEKHFHQNIGTIIMRDNISKWGSCTDRNNISVSTRLMYAPDWVINYVLVHELAHMVHPDHSKNFYDLVEKVEPNFKEAELYLKQHGEEYYF